MAEAAQGKDLTQTHKIKHRLSPDIVQTTGLLVIKCSTKADNLDSCVFHPLIHGKDVFKIREIELDVEGFIYTLLRICTREKIEKKIFFKTMMR